MLKVHFVKYKELNQDDKGLRWAGIPAYMKAQFDNGVDVVVMEHELGAGSYLHLVSKNQQVANAILANIPGAVTNPPTMLRFDAVINGRRINPKLIAQIKGLKVSKK